MRRAFGEWLSLAEAVRNRFARSYPGRRVGENKWGEHRLVSELHAAARNALFDLILKHIRREGGWGLIERGLVVRAAEARCKDVIRRAKAREKRVRPGTGGRPDEAQPVIDDAPDGGTLGDPGLDAIDCMVYLFARLPDDERAVVEAHYLRKEEQADVDTERGDPGGTAKRLCHQARQRLREFKAAAFGDAWFGVDATRERRDADG
jgi:hypothetical protein